MALVLGVVALLVFERPGGETARDEALSSGPDATQPAATGTTATGTTSARAPARSRTATTTEVAATSSTSREGHPYSSDLYSLDVPRRWINDADAVDRGAYLESRWHLKGEADVYFLVDVTPGYDHSARTGARDVRKLFDAVDDYDEIAFGAHDVAGRSGWQWRFRLLDRDTQKVDTFLTGCGNGYAMLGAAPITRFDDYDSVFTGVLDSMSLPCEG